jgi:hypothetical protein
MPAPFHLVFWLPLAIKLLTQAIHGALTVFPPRALSFTPPFSQLVPLVLCPETVGGVGYDERFGKSSPWCEERIGRVYRSDGGSTVRRSTFVHHEPTLF